MTTQALHFSRALDEGYHLEYITFIKENSRLPIDYEERAQVTRADFPPLYQLLVVALSVGVELKPQPDFKFFHDSFRYRAIDVQSDQPWTLDTEDLSPPHFGRFFVWQIGRWLSVGLSLITLVLLFLTLQEIPLGWRPLTSLFGAALLAFIPRYLILSAALNDDSLLAVLAAFYFLMLVKLIKAPHRWGPLLGLALALGLSATVKYSLVLLPLEIGVVFALLAYRWRLGWRWVVGRFAAVGLVALLVSSWWFGWNIWHFNTVAQDGLITGVTRSLFGGGYNATLNQLGEALTGETFETAATPQTTQDAPLSRWATVTFTSLWGYSIGGQTPLAGPAYAFIGVLLTAAGVGLVRLWRTQAESRPWILLALFHLALLVVIPLVRFETSGRIGQTAQGRHILVPAATVIVALLVWGVAALLPRRRLGLGLGIILAAFIVWSGLHLSHLMQPGTPPLPLRTLAQAAAWLPQPVNARFGENIELVSYDLEPQPAQGRLSLSLGWRSLGYVNESYLLDVQVVDNAGAILSQWVGYHGQGRLPTLTWDPGDSVFDRLLLPLPNLPAGRYQVQVQLRGANDQPLPVKNADQLTLTTFTLTSPAVLKTEGPAMVWPPSAGATTSFRYPGTIMLVVENSDLPVQLVDPAGNHRQPARNVNGIVNFVIGPRWPTGHYQLRLDGQPVELSVAVENWWPRTFTVPDEIETTLSANFANQIYLLGYSLPQKQVQPGQAFPVTLYWQAPSEKAPQANFIQFNNLLDSSGVQRGGYDRLPLEYYSTLLWEPGEIVVDGYAVPVDAEAPPGQYYLNVGYYLTVGESAVNLPLVVEGQMSEVTSVTIGPVEVVEPVEVSNER